MRAREPSARPTPQAATGAPLLVAAIVMGFGAVQVLATDARLSGG